MVEVRQDFDQYADFDSYTTYSWLPKQEEAINTVSGGWTRENQNLAGHLKTAIAKELAEKEFAAVKYNPDVYVVYYIGVKDKLGQVDYELDYTQQFTNSDVWHKSGAVIVVELINRETDHLVWRGQAHGAVNVDPTPEMVEKNVNRAIGKIFEQYPPETLGDR
jgi:hypothetical protein